MKCTASDGEIWSDDSVKIFLGTDPKDQSYDQITETIESIGTDILFDR